MGDRLVRRCPSTARGYLFLSLDDETELVNVIVRPPVIARYQRTIRGTPVVAVRGELEDESGAVQVMATTVTAISSIGPSIRPSHDWH